jgi:uncharacterized protein YbjQ (UPF0145 family)
MEALIGLLFLLFPLVLLLGAGFAGRLLSRRHFAAMARREAALSGLRVSTLSGFPGGAGPKAPKMIVANVCYSLDYFLSWISGLRKLFGGEMKAYRRLAERARREALLRLLEEAKREGYDGVCNVRFELADIGYNPNSGKRGVVRIEIIASATAYQIAGAPAA